MADRRRLEELERRIQQDPASIAFAQLAEEHRRLGHFDDAVRVARDGLARYPGYISPRVTLGRALIDLERYDDASAELHHVMRLAPDNLAAIRALAELHDRCGDIDVPDVSEAPLKQLEGWLAAILHDRAERA